MLEAMQDPELEVRPTPLKGRGVFTRARIAQGQKILTFQGRALATEALSNDLLVMQIGPELWLCSDGSLLDDCLNHSCEPNAGFLDCEPVLYALRDIEAGEEIGWDYSTSISEPGWSMDCRCESQRCRGVIRPWGELAAADREPLRGLALGYLRGS
jgi:SET domain-containing protein